MARAQEGSCHQHRHGTVKGFGEGETKQWRQHDKQCRTHQHDGHEVKLEAACEALRGRFLRLRFGHHLHHARQRAFLRQLAHPAHAELLRIVVQAQADAAAFVDNMHLLQAFGLQQSGQPPYADVASSATSGKTTNRSNFSFSVMMLLLGTG